MGTTIFYGGHIGIMKRGLGFIGVLPKQGYLLEVLLIGIRVF